MKNNAANKFLGFSLVELAVTLTIVAVILGISVTAFDGQLKGTKYNSDQAKLISNKAFLLEYFDKAKRLPCPADPTLIAGDANYGVASASCDVGDVCPAGLVCNGISVEGDFPFKTLGLSPDDIKDSYGSKIIYAVDRTFTRVSSGYCQSNGRIVMQDYADNTISDTTMFALVAHGEDRAGARGFESNSIAEACNTTFKDGQNCDGNAVFRVSDLVLNASTSTDYYDDIVVWSENPERKKCPAGLTGCFAWYDAADVCSIYLATTTRATAWFDKSSDNSSKVLTAASTGVAPGIVYSSVNGKASLFFDGANDYMTAPGYFDFPLTDFTIVNVFRTNDTSGSISEIVSSASVSPISFSYIFRITGSQLGFRLWSDPEYLSGGNYADNSPHYGIMRIGGDDVLKYYLDGNLLTERTGVFTGGTYSFTHLLIGGSSLYGYISGYPLELIYFDRKLTNYEMKVLGSYLDEKWGI